jgi:drug/metabolite transporter (DMT)-like permease
VLVLPGGLTSPDGEPVRAWGLAVIVVAAACWALGSFLSSRIPMPRDAFVATTWEMLAGGVGLLLSGSVSGELADLDLGAVSGAAWAWLAYLVLVGSLVAFSAYVWLLAHAPISLTATYAYVNPVVAVLLGALVLGEPITAAVVAGGAVVVLGVGLVVTSERPRRRGTPPEPPPGGGGAEVVDLRT